MELTDFEALSFDCYGTLIDWEAGIGPPGPVGLRRAASKLDRRGAAGAYAGPEAAAEATPAGLYPHVLARA